MKLTVATDGKVLNITTNKCQKQPLGVTVGRHESPSGTMQHPFHKPAQSMAQGKKNYVQQCTLTAMQP